MRDTRRDLLKQLLQGKADPETVAKALQRLNPLGEIVPVFSYADEPDIYKVGDKAGLTKDEMKEAIAGKTPFMITIRRSGPPVASCEKAVAL
ncbi:hypothetical protein MKJ04_11475 [Pontibacter sp. E15-1]|uniref:hypothetical protein n=1 Tax=Pontibacter sp. E15-1 TaxID=2919918 RepID=UPI001F4FB26A|nr:hypothetical protein [Pontibacter sp. E15-1]MCJ8165464.1 hypothetical protein [Pontibacter sp. E15-1]